MHLRTLAGAYAGQVRDYSTVAGFAALRSGTAERLDTPLAQAVQVPVADAADAPRREAQPPSRSSRRNR